MKRIFFLFFIALISVPVSSENKKLQELLIVLDGVMSNKDEYDKQKIHRINEIENLLAKEEDQTERFNLTGMLFTEFKNYQLDSTLKVAEYRFSEAERTENNHEILWAEMNIAEVMIVTGMYKESLDILNNLEANKFDSRQKSYYFHLYHSLYLIMADYSFSENEKKESRKLVLQYKDSILSALPSDDSGHRIVLCSKLLEDGKPQEALKLAEECYDESPHNASYTYILSTIYNRMGDKEKEMEYLALSAIDDIKTGAKEYISLRLLAVYLYESGDIKRAYTYSKCSMEDAIFCNARIRTLEISHMLPIINEAYDMRMKDEREQLYKFTVIVSFLVLILMTGIFYIYWQLKALAVARRSLKETNKNLNKINGELNELNVELSESNLVKEEYIGYVFNICSTYIDKLENYRKNVNRKIKAGQIDDLRKMTVSSSLVEDELKEFYKSFDSVFLKLYPAFVEEFNNMLTDDEKQIPKEGDILTPKLRIYALVRLGITDSAKIADFLHYSLQTVYNYRQKIRNSIKVSLEDFKSVIRKIGNFDAKKE
jgi:hypothetical protein